MSTQMKCFFCERLATYHPGRDTGLCDCTICGRYGYSDRFYELFERMKKPALERLSFIAENIRCGDRGEIAYWVLSTPAPGTTLPSKHVPKLLRNYEKVPVNHSENDERAVFARWLHE